MSGGLRNIKYKFYPELSTDVSPPSSLEACQRQGASNSRFLSNESNYE